jgi:hypothetical protein
MFERMIAEDIKMNSKNTSREDECIDSYMIPVEHKSSIIDRVLIALGNAMISVGLKLKYRSHALLTAEQAQAPNFLIML